MYFLTLCNFTTRLFIMKKQQSFCSQSLHSSAVVALTLLCVGLFSSCEQVITSNVQPEYVPKILLFGSLIAGEPISVLYVARTLPLFDTVNAERSALTTATIRLRVDGREYPMQLEPMRILNANGGAIFQTPRSYYSTTPPVIAEAGKRYEIIAEWQGLRARVETFIPLPVPVEAAREIIVDEKDPRTGVDIRRYQYELTFTPQAGVAYRAGFLGGTGADTASAFDFSPTPGSVLVGLSDSAPIVTQPAADSTGKIRLLSPTALSTFIPGRGWTTIENPHVVLYQFDEAFAEYSRTFGNSFASSNPFTIGGVNAKWNVTGDGVGIVVGVSSSRLRVR
jgi:hypothetical protein